MKNAEKEECIIQQCNALVVRVNALQGSDKGFFNYDLVHALLHTAIETIDRTERYTRPVDLPEDMPWEETPWNGEDADIYVFMGDMSSEDCETMHRHMECDSEKQED